MNTKLFTIILLFFTFSFLSKTAITPIHQKLFGTSLAGEWVQQKDSAILGMKHDVITNQSLPVDENQTPKGTSWLDFIGIVNQKDDNMKMIGFIPNKRGEVEVLITEGPLGKPIVYLQLRSHKYIDQRLIQLSFQLTKGFSTANNQWKTPKFLTAVRLYENLQNVATIDVVMNFQMKYTLKQQVEIKLLSDSLNMLITVKSVDYDYRYLMIFSCVNALQILILLYYRKDQNVQHRAQLSNTSEWLVLHSCLFILVQIFFLIKVAVAYFDTTLSLLLLNVISNFVVFVLVIQSFETVLQKFKNKLVFLISIAFTLIYFHLVFNYYHSNLFWVLESCILLWQIGYSILRGGDGGVSILFIFVIVLSRIPLIIMLMEENVLKLRPDELVGKVITGILAIHFFVIVFQKKFGGRFFTPLAIMPDYFNYLRQITYSSQLAQKDCSICTNSLRAPHDETPQQVRQRQLDEINIPGFRDKSIEIVCTPCNHAFHRVCLSEWLQVHLVCPMDRNGLPPMNF